MRAHELRTDLQNARILDDAQTQRIVCKALEVFRDYLSEKVIERKGVVGFIVKIGLREAVKLLDEYLAANCGINLYP